MPSDLTAAIEAAKRLKADCYSTDWELYKTAHTKRHEDEEALLQGVLSLDDLTSQPLYRRRKAEWINGSWRDCRVNESMNGNGKWCAFRFSFGVIGWCATEAGAQAACEEHFWAELEASVLERVQ